MSNVNQVWQKPYRVVYREVRRQEPSRNSRKDLADFVLIKSLSIQQQPFRLIVRRHE